MRTHRIKFVCSSVECANWIEDNILHDDYCDLTHWYCGLDGAGEDTPDSCIIYHGVLEPSEIYVEVDINALGQGTTQESILAEYENLKSDHYFKNHGDWKVEDVSITELPGYTTLKAIESKLSTLEQMSKIEHSEMQAKLDEIENSLDEALEHVGGENNE